MRILFSLLLVVIAILLPFGVIISYKIATKCGFTSDSSYLTGISRYFSSIFSKNSSNNSYLGESVVLFGDVKTANNQILSEYSRVLK